MFLDRIFKSPDKTQISLFNTLTRKKEVFKPRRKGEVSLYSCGPTVYNYMHIGNLRAYIFADILKRTLLLNGYKVKHLMNVTDIGHLTSDADDGEDKMVKALKRENLPMTLESLKIVSKKYFDAFVDDFKEMNVEMPEKFVFASDEIAEEEKRVQELLDKCFAYKTSDGIYFDTLKLPDYPRLGGSASIDHSRIGVNSEKKNPRDFAVWKFADKGGIGFDASFGKGFPGWHIECSAIVMKYLGDQIDIHTGGVDHIAVHHNNEIAQAEAATGKLLANYWMHNNHLTIKDDKMAKSGENFLTLKTLKEKGISPLAYRYWLLTSKYSTRIDYSEEAIKAAESAYRKLLDFIADTQEEGSVVDSYRQKFLEAINDDLETPKALALVWEVVKDAAISNADKKTTILYFDQVLGLDLASAKKEEFVILEEVQKLLDERKLAKENKDFQKADLLRKEIENKGFSINDQKDGSQLLTKI